MAVVMAFVVFVGLARSFFLDFLWSEPARRTGPEGEQIDGAMGQRTVRSDYYHQ